MTDTPETDAEFMLTQLASDHRMVKFARRLERQRNQALTALRRIASNVEGGQSLSGTDCRDIALEALGVKSGEWADGISE